MAKQSGIHQLRGKVGEHSYYRQTGVSSGLVRQINQGMSERVKTDEAFANTRANNAEFGQAGRIASMLAQYIQPKFRPMVLPFSQSKMASIILEFIKQDEVATWGHRNLSVANSGVAQARALNSVAKNDFRNLGIVISCDEESTTISYQTTDETKAKVDAIGASGVEFRLYVTASWIGTYWFDLKYHDSSARSNYYPQDVSAARIADTTTEVEYALPSAPPQGWPAFQADRMAVLIALPYREVNGARSYLQEHCTYFAFKIEDGQIL